MFACVGSWCGTPVAMEKKDDDARLRAVQQWKSRFSVLHVRAASHADIQEERVIAMVNALLLLQPLDTIEDEVTDHLKRVMERCRYIGCAAMLSTLSPFISKDPLIKRIYEAVYCVPVIHRKELVDVYGRHLDRDFLL